MIAQINAKTERVIEELVASGGYADETDVIEQAVLLLRKRVQDQRLIQSINDAHASIERGEGVKYDENFWDLVDQQAEAADRAGLPINPDVLP